MAVKGEGSRGGHIIGHTKGGSPIYGDPATRTEHEEKRARIAKGIGIAAAGLGAAALFGVGAGKIARKGADLQNKAHDLAALAKRGKNVARQAKVAKFAVQNDLLRQGFDKAHDLARGTGALVGTTAGVYGTSQALEASGQNSAKNVTLGAAAATGAALFTVRVAEYAQLTHLAAAVKVAKEKIRKPIKRGF